MSYATYLSTHLLNRYENVEDQCTEHGCNLCVGVRGRERERFVFTQMCIFMYT